MTIIKRTGRIATKVVFTAIAIFLLAAGMAHNINAAPPVPLPAYKPLHTDSTHTITASKVIPLPDRKPDFDRPGISQLLAFGQAPRPKVKPMRNSTALMSPQDALLYKRIFSYQSMAKWDKADELMAYLTDFRLRGHVLSQRYLHPTSYRTSFDELSGWLDLYADHPEATRIYRLAQGRAPKDFKGALRKPIKGKSINGYLRIFSDYDKTYISAKKRSSQTKSDIKALRKTVRRHLAKGAPTSAYKHLNAHAVTKQLDPAEYDHIQAQIAAGYMYAGKLKKAQKLATASAERSGDKVPLAGWVAGLSSWHLKQYKPATRFFELAALSPYASDWTVSAAAYWASRANMRSGKVRDVNHWLKKAAAHPRTFYGLIATRALGWDFDFNWSMPTFTEEHKKQLQKFPAAARAMALVSAGQYHLAEDELRQIDLKKDSVLITPLLAYASSAGLPSFAMRIAEAVPHPDGGLYDAALYPLSPWRPQSGYKVDRALIHALIRQESRFDPMAESRSGATGLMQLMPATASFVSGNRKLKSDKGRHSLKDPQLNLDIGQRYVENLLGQSQIRTELFSLVMAYNAGPGNLRKWKTKYADIEDDPLLFIESIPLGETRSFVERVMANYWIYQLRLGQPTPSLDAVIGGRWAHYVPQGNGSKHAAAETNGTRRVTRGFN